MKIAFLFIKWIFRNLFNKISEKNNDFRYTLRNSPWEAIFFWFMFTFLTSILTMLLLAGVQFVTGWDVPVQVWFTYIASCVFYLLYTGFSIMYNAFKAERAELFETIKNGR